MYPPLLLAQHTQGPPSSCLPGPSLCPSFSLCFSCLPLFSLRRRQGAEEAQSFSCSSPSGQVLEATCFLSPKWSWACLHVSSEHAEAAASELPHELLRRTCGQAPDRPDRHGLPQVPADLCAPPTSCCAVLGAATCSGPWSSQPRQDWALGVRLPTGAWLLALCPCHPAKVTHYSRASDMG